MKSIISPLITLILLVSSAFANTALANTHSEIIIENSYVRESIPGTSISSAYMTIRNLSAKSISLISASSTVSDRIEIHQHTMVDGMMRMRQRDNVEIAAKQSTVFQPSGYHLMMFDLKQPLKSKEKVNITLHFSDQTSIDVHYIVQGLKQKKHHH